MGYKASFFACRLLRDIRRSESIRSDECSVRWRSLGFIEYLLTTFITSLGASPPVQTPMYVGRITRVEDFAFPEGRLSVWTPEGCSFQVAIKFTMHGDRRRYIQLRLSILIRPLTRFSTRAWVFSDAMDAFHTSFANGKWDCNWHGVADLSIFFEKALLKKFNPACVSKRKGSTKYSFLTQKNPGNYSTPIPTLTLKRTRIVMRLTKNMLLSSDGRSLLTGSLILILLSISQEFMYGVKYYNLFSRKCWEVTNLYCGTDILWR